MVYFWKATAAVLIALVLSLTLEKQSKDFSVLLTLAVCCMTAGTAFVYLEPVLDFLWELESLAKMQGEMLGILLKAAGVGLAAELAAVVCTDGGYASLGKQLQLLGSAVILYLSLPVFRSLLTLIQEILGEL